MVYLRAAALKGSSTPEAIVLVEAIIIKDIFQESGNLWVLGPLSLFGPPYLAIFPNPLTALGFLVLLC